ncbi:hypothetical protein LJ753_10870 [Arthrobacter sp. zg-Y20]|uniref:hypothetical protein n=1 Tax=unclassified Arthrobacter TaxID=235627 RepID=UPI001D1530FA|nr:MULTISPECIES: hypothetical protein [unclassified Arthrobacter]MCC3276372.1 hypothetical protein [Arthrobacter sp. zg-Y20]MDK1316531.1 hypothetical protein [Arthrobacter sp. zg.Y20]WIB06572.1 hypothetical protein QNO06_02170 [Arthrobacter sp. zg-Y20]
MTTENTTPAAQDTEELDLDDWLTGGQRKAHPVTLYSRADLLADIEELEAERRIQERMVSPEDAPLGGSPTTDLDGRIDALYAQLHASKKEFRVSSLTQPEVEVIRAQVRKDLKEAIDLAAAEAREEAKNTVRRMGVTTPAEVNNVLRAQALEAANKVIEHETTARVLAACTVMRRGAEWVSLTVEQVKRIEKTIGSSQIDNWNRAFSRAANEAPVVTVPKSRKP